MSPNDKYPELLLAAAQVKNVASHFPEVDQKILTRGGATPSAYLASRPEEFSYIHFVAHATASRLSPLDSAIVRSKDSAQDEFFKLLRSGYRRLFQEESGAGRSCNDLGVLQRRTFVLGRRPGRPLVDFPPSWGPQRCCSLVGRVGRFYRATHGKVLRFAQQRGKPGRRSARRQTVIASRQGIPQSLLLGTLSTLSALGLRSRTPLGWRFCLAPQGCQMGYINRAPKRGGRSG